MLTKLTVYLKNFSLSGTNYGIKAVLYQSSSAFLLRLISAIAAFTFTFIIAKKMGEASLGIYSLTFSVTVFSSILARVGFDNSVLKYVAASYSIRNQRNIAHIHNYSLKVIIINSLLLTLFLFFLCPIIVSNIFSKPELVSHARIMILGILPYSLVFIYSEIFRGMDKIIFSVLLHVLLPAFSIVFFLIFYSFGDSAAPEIAFTSASFITAIIAFLYWIKVNDKYTDNLEIEYSSKKILATGIPLYYVAIAGFLLQNSDIFFLGRFASDTSEIGIYSAASRTAILINLVLLSVNSIVAPRFSSYYSLGEFKQLQSLARNTSAILLLINSPVILALLLFPKTILGIFGSTFSAGALPLQILAIGQLINISTGSVGYLLMMTGYEKIMRNNMIFACLLNVFMNCVLVPAYGMVGAAISTATTLAFQNIIAVYFSWSKLGIMTVPFFPGFNKERTF